MSRACVDCDVSLTYRGRGRPRKRCEACQRALLAAKKRAYYEANRDELAAKKRAYSTERGGGCGSGSSNELDAGPSPVARPASGPEREDGLRDPRRSGSPLGQTAPHSPDDPTGERSDRAEEDPELVELRERHYQLGFVEPFDDVHAEKIADIRLSMERGIERFERIAEEERGFEGVGDFDSADPYERHLAHNATKGRS